MTNVLGPNSSSREQAEREIIQFLFTRPADAHVVFSQLTDPEAFASSTLRAIFSAAVSVYRAGDLTNGINVRRELEKSGSENIRLDAVYAECRDASLSECTPDNAEIAVSILVERWNEDRARAESAKVSDWRGWVSLARTIHDLNAGISDDRTRTPAEIAGEIINKQRAIYEGKAEAGYSWGLPRVDEVCRLTPGLYIVAGLKKGAKTHFLLSVLDHNLTTAEPVPSCLFSLEMSDVNIFKRLLARHTGVDSHRIHSKYLARDDFDKLKREYERLKSGAYPLHVDDGASLTVTDIASRARRWKYKNKVPDGVGLIGVDFLQLIRMERRNGDSEASGIKHIAYSLARLAKDLDIAVIACAQFSNEAEGQVPHIGYLEGSGAIAQSAEAILIVDLIRRRDRGHVSEGDGEDVNIIVGEQRNGESGVRVKCTVDLKTSRFYEKNTR